jgi:hypothetical protein
MRQVQDNLVWLGMILVVAAVIYVMPFVAKLVGEARGELPGSSLSYRNVTSVSHHHSLVHHRGVR